MDPQFALWNSLEIAKMIVDLALPMVLAIIGVAIFKFEKRVEKKIEHLAFTLEWRKDKYDGILSDLNTLFQAFNYVGNWRNLHPTTIVSLKRNLDAAMYSYRPLFSDDTISKYEELMDVSFEVHKGRGKSLLIRANREMYSESCAVWDDVCAELFVEPSRRTKRSDFRLKHQAVLEAIFRDMGFPPNGEGA